MNDLVERLRKLCFSAYCKERNEAAAEIERLRAESDEVLTRAMGIEAERDIARAEVELWKERWESERRDHEATINYADKTMRGEP